MKYQFLHERKSNLSPTQWYIHFSSILIQIKVVGFGMAEIFEKRILYNSKQGQCNECAKLPSIRINISVRKSK